MLINKLINAIVIAGLIKIRYQVNNLMTLLSLVTSRENNLLVN